MSKCQFLKRQVEYLGHIIDGYGIHVDPKKIEEVSKWETPNNIKQVESFIGFCNYYRKFVTGFAKIAAPLTNLTRKNNSFKRTKSEKDSFESLKRALNK